MKEWKTYTVGEVCETISETYRRNDNEVVLVNTSDVLEGNVLNHQLVENKNLKGQFKKTFIKEDILYSEIRPANKRYAFVDFDNTENYIASTKLMVLRPNKDVILPRFLFAFLTSKNVLAELQHLAETRSGTFPQITFSSELAPMEIQVPDFETQSKIVEILDLLEEKVKNNEAINDNLQAQAFALYSKMIIDNADDTWTPGVLSDIAEITMGQSPKGDTYNEDGVGTVFFQGRAEFGFRFPTRRLCTTEPKRMAQTNDALMSVRAPVGDMNVAYEDCCIGRGLAAIHSKDNHQSYVLYTMFNLHEQLNVFNGEGTVFGSINKDALNAMPINIPPTNVIDAFEEIVAPMDKAIRNNYEEICHLTNIRDSLLPRLMSGEIDVAELDI